MLRVLSSRHCGLTVQEMANELDVNEKTIRRDLDLFRRLRFPLEEQVGIFGRKTWRIRKEWSQPPLGFSFDEAIALYLGRRLLEPLAGTLIWEAAEGALRKIRATLGRLDLENLDRFAGLFHHTTLGHHDYSARVELIDDLELAVNDGKPARILYRSERATEPAYRDVNPYGLVDHRGALYLVAQDPLEGKVKLYKLDRIEAVEIGEGTFPRPPDFDLKAYLSSSFGVYQSDGDLITIKVRFAPEVARYIQESTWHASQRLTNQRDGGVLAEFRLSSTGEIKSWILSFGSKALVLEPASLRLEIADELQSLVRNYESLYPAPDRRADPTDPTAVASRPSTPVGREGR
ncbi:MAG: WYL domain-containing transcriptional regulator [Planctomycetaceae bacterium]|nr:WYL domain-containing transcriptional regulator [Planctomycetaceae bacterium]